MIVNNYFYAQIVGSAIAVATMFVVFATIRRWKPWILDIFVAASVQLLVATHLLPAAQLAASYEVLLLVLMLADRTKRAIGRILVFAIATLVLTYFNPFSRVVYDIAQSEAGAHINLFGDRLAQICLLGVASWASISLLRGTYRSQPAGIVVGSLGLGTCCFATLQILLFWCGLGSHYAIAKNMFFVIAVFIFVCSALLALSMEPWGKPRWAHAAVGLPILTLVTTRADLSPVICSMKDVVRFQRSVDSIANGLLSNDKTHPIIFSTFWPENLSYGMTIGDMKLNMGRFADAILNRDFPPISEASFLLTAAKDPIIRIECIDPKLSSAAVIVMDYACFKSQVPDLNIWKGSN